jgi:hypothetical protein
MRRSALVALLALVAALSTAFAADRSDAAPPRATLAEALVRTTHTASLRFAYHVGIREFGIPLTLHVRGQSDRHTISVHLATAGLSAQEVLVGPFLYEQAPNGMVVNGKWRWLRVNVSGLRAGAPAIAVMHALTAEPLLRVVGTARLAGEGSIFHGGVRYDDPVVRAALSRLTGGIEFRGLRLTVRVGEDGRIHRIRLTGKTADRSSSFLLSARLFAFNRPVHVSPPKPGTFLDKQLAHLGV